MVMTVIAMIFSPERKKYHWTIIVLILPLIRYSGTEFESYNSHFPYIASIFLCMPQPSGKAGHALSVITPRACARGKVIGCVVVVVVVVVVSRRIALSRDLGT